MDIFTFISRYFWLLALVMTGVNALFYHQRFRALAADHPERAEGYQRFLIGFVAVNAALWLVMGVGVMFGGVPSVFAFFNPVTGGPLVLAWHAMLIAVWIAGIVWLFFLGGAQFFIDHPGLANFTDVYPLRAGSPAA